MVILGTGSYAIDFQDESVLALNKKNRNFQFTFSFLDRHHAWRSLDPTLDILFTYSAETVWKSIAPDPALNIFIVNFLKESVISRIVKTEYTGIRH